MNSKKEEKSSTSVFVPDKAQAIIGHIVKERFDLEDKIREIREEQNMLAQMAIDTALLATGKSDEDPKRWNLTTENGRYVLVSQ